MKQTTFVRLVIVLFGGLLLGTGSVDAQPAIKSRIEKSTTTRRPNDDLEGTIWQYRATRKEKGDNESEEKEIVLEGRFRIEEKGVFEADKQIELPGRPLPGLRKNNKGEGNAAGDAKDDSKGKSITVPSAKGRRIGDVTKTNDGKTKLVIEAKDFPLQGIVIVWPKKDRPGVWMGTYQERKNDKNGDKWVIELRESED
ncbi:MAG: hypothetical protein H7062_25070 [Candidatus Saccharimonas sp.]|nr:hypothetical protein [Planctomycetaceae bacterium]